MLKREDLFHEEKLSLLLYMKYKVFLSTAESGGKIKNTIDAQANRNEGNKLFKSRPHDASIHLAIIYYYSKSIAFSPTNSEDLAKGYTNRSALFFHIKNYKDCVIDIKRALSITCDNFLKLKLLCRKAEALKMLNESKKCERACQAGLQILEQLYDSKKNVFAEKFNQLLSSQNSIKKTDIKLPKRDSYFDDLLNFERSEEMPTVSKSVSIKFNNKWGRHIVATEDIKPGEIISIQKCNFVIFDSKRMYLLCSYCNEASFNSVACEFCIYDIYCSEECCSKAWNEYHKYECIIYQHSTTLDSILFMRFVLSAIYEVGGIEKMKEHILEIENTKDPQIKGLSKGIFDTEYKKNIFSFKKTYSAEPPSYEAEYSLMADICNYIYLLAKFTNFFGEKINILEPEILIDENRLFIASMMLRTKKIILSNGEIIRTSTSTGKSVDISVEFFNCMINHQCHSNVRILRLGGGRSITYACRPIRKGSQLFKSFNQLYITTPKKIRQQVLKQYEMACECIACTEDWSPIAKPTIEELINTTPSLYGSIVEKNRILLEQINSKNGDSRFTAELFMQVCHHLADLAEKFTVICNDYYLFIRFIEEILLRAYFKPFELPEECN